MEQLASLYQAYTGTAPDKVTELPASGSNRRYFRLEGSPTLIGVVGTCLEENEAFLYMADHFLKHNIPVPRVVAVADDRMSYLQEDLGDTILFNAIEKGRQSRSFSADEKELLIRTIRMLPDIDDHDRMEVEIQRCILVCCCDDLELMISICHQPCITRTKDSECRFLPFTKEIGKRTKLIIDLIPYTAQRLSSRIPQSGEKKLMVINTASIVSH